MDMMPVHVHAYELLQHLHVTHTQQLLTPVYIQEASGYSQQLFAAAGMCSMEWDTDSALLQQSLSLRGSIGSSTGLHGSAKLLLQHRQQMQEQRVHIMTHG